MKMMESDWVSQWELFAEGFRDGKAHIDLTSFGGRGVLRLYPGPGFGDLSHPTTRLMLLLMQGRIEGKSVVDIGSGSGILTLASLLMRALSSFGVDIDPEAIEHAKRNSELNSLSELVDFSLELPPLNGQSVFLMNMIFSEQKVVDPSRYHLYAKEWIVSGILEEQKGAYLEWVKVWGWELLEEKSLDGWVGFRFRPVF